MTTALAMGRRRFWLAAAGVGAIAAGAGYGVSRWLSRADLAAVSDAAVRALTAKRLPDLSGQPRSLDEWQSKALVVNFWATWCAPCRKEIPDFVRAQERYGPAGLQIVGIAFDQPEAAAEFVREFRINYPVLIAGMDTMVLMREAGNRQGVLPFSLMLGPGAKVVGTQLGVLSEERLVAVMGPFLSSTGGQFPSNCSKYCQFPVCG